jgi:carbamate kinase
MRAAYLQRLGVEAVTDRDRASALLSPQIGAESLITATAAPAVFVGFGTPDPKANLKAHPERLLAEEEDEFAGWTLPKVTAACGIARSTGKPAL